MKYCYTNKYQSVLYWLLVVALHTSIPHVAILCKSFGIIRLQDISFFNTLYNLADYQHDQQIRRIRCDKKTLFFYLSLYLQTTYVHSHPLYRQSPSESIGFLTQPIENTKLTTNFRGRACPKSLCIKDLRLVDHQLKEKAAAGFPATALPFSP